MRKLFNIRLKDIPNVRVLAIGEIKRGTNFGTKESKDLLDKILDKAELSFDNNYDEFFGLHYSIEAYMIDYFDYDVIDDNSNQNIREPDEVTKEALAWLETLSEKDKERIKLIGDWENPYCGMIAVC